MSLFPVKTILKCFKCEKDFTYTTNTLDFPLEPTCKECDNLYFKGYKESSKYFNIDAD